MEKKPQLNDALRQLHARLSMLRALKETKKFGARWPAQSRYLHAAFLLHVVQRKRWDEYLCRLAVAQEIPEIKWPTNP